MKTRLDVKGMKCPSCELLITDALEELEPVKDAFASHSEGFVEIEHDAAAKIDDFKIIIRKEGFDVK